jgi:formyltetrahydrofolate deformylase
MALFVSKYDHCLYDILGRCSGGASRNTFNHQQVGGGTFSIPFRYVPFTKDIKTR